MRTEQDILRLSIMVTFALAAFGVGFGIWTGSSSIIFDGVYTTLDASMTVLALLVSRLITDSLSESARARLVQHFTMGFWHLEPIVLGLSGTLLIVASGYALLTAISDILSGGRALEFGHAVIYAVIAGVVAAAMALFGHRQNRSIGSAFLALDVKAWTISAGLTSALLVAFVFGWLIQGTRLEWLSPYVDPAALALVCLIVLPMPIPTVRGALADILLVTPRDLREEVEGVAQQIVDQYGFLDYRAYVARVGRGRQIELYFIVPTGTPPRALEEWDAIRDEIAPLIEGRGPDRWLTIAFTTDLNWAT
ncbi:cation diffusion facilitator family transporter [Falsirhodobacter halotolerans]|uniref:cation diffusion facilitator family transporter n=1 Tax=Falsirhodobacter halotolerans TaxID=1146892 RepID=UPI001FD1C1E1|nr:cation transporter [Falsirhodobacter halotolerans]MCJ8140226.1 cation transporter [Falsirhodobacter halotolerans]